MSTQITVTVSNIATVIQSFNVIRIKRSVDGIDGPYTLLTDDVPTAASLLSTITGPYNVVGKTLEISVDFQVPILVVFTGTDPLSTTEVVNQINTALGDTVAVDDANALKLLSTITGTGSGIEVVSGTSLADFNWTAGDNDTGEDAHIPLQAGVGLYDYLDKNGDASFHYIAQYFNTINQLASTDSEPFTGVPGTVVGQDNLSLAKVALSDGTGVAVEGQAITFWSVYETIEADAFVVGIQRKPIATITTNSKGRAETKLVRGLRVKVVFEGTSIIREFVVPDQIEFDLLDELSDFPDPFDIKVPDFNLALRRTL
jgi:hypothetical protein